MVDAGAATDYLWTVEQGELVTLRIPVLDAAGQPFVVDNWTVDAKIKDMRGNTVYTFPAGDCDASGTDVELTIPPAASLLWTFTTGRYRVKVTHPTDPTQVHRILQGRLLVSED